MIRRKSDIAFLIPAFNEEHYLASVISSIRSLYDFDIVVINDGSHDKTEEVASRSGALVISHPSNQGVGAALRTGLNTAHKLGYTTIIQVDADGQHEITDIDKLLLARDKADVVIGVRDFSEYKASSVRRMAIAGVRALLKLHHLGHITDPTSGFRLFNRKAIEFFSSNMPREYLGDTVEALINGYDYGLSYEQVPVTMHPRQAGNPSQDFIGSFRSLAVTASYIVAVSISRRKP